MNKSDSISRADAIEAVSRSSVYAWSIEQDLAAHSWAIRILRSLPSAESEQYKKGFEDAKRAFLVEYERESENMRKRNAELEVMLNAYREISADAVQGEWILVKGSNGKDYHKCSKCLHIQEITGVKNYCAVCGAKMKGGDDE